MISISIILSLVSLSFSQLRLEFTKKPSKYPEHNNIVVPVEIGTPPQRVPLSLEFFSTAIWVIDDECGDTVLANAKQIPFTPRLSSTYKKQIEEISNKEYEFNPIAHYIKAIRASDTFLINDTKLTNFSFVVFLDISFIF